MNKYRLVAKKGEGTFSEVLKAQCIKNGKYVAIKCMKNHFDSLDQVNNLREIQALRRLSPHPHIIKLLEVLYDQPTGRLALVFELMDMNIYELIRGRRHYVAEERVRSYMYQLMKALDHMHRNGIFHRDIKPENILIMDDVLKLADFGSCRGIYSKQPYTEYISTRWYRAPECLLTDGYYNYKMDMWGVGCVMFEIVALYPLFPGNNELDQIQKIHTIMGTPSPELLAKLKKRSSHSSSFDFPPCDGSGLSKLLAHVPPDCADLIAKLLAYNPDERLSARQALRHPYFRERREADKRAKAAMQPDIAGSSYLCAMDSEASSHPQQGQQLAGAAAAVRRTDSGDLGEPAAAGTDVLAAAVGPSNARQGARGTNAAAAAAAATATTATQQAAGVAGVLTEHLAAVASAAAAAVAAAATAAAAGGTGMGQHGTLPAIGNSSTRPQQHQQQQHSHALPSMLQQQQQQQQQPSQLFMHQQHQHRQQHAPHGNSNSSSMHQGPPLQQQSQQQQTGLPQHSMQATQQQRQRQQQQQGHAPLEGLQGHQLLGGQQLLGSSSIKDRDGSIMQLMAESSLVSMSAAGHHQASQGFTGLGLQASVGSLWQEGSGLGLPGPGQALPPLPGSKTSSSGALQSARRRSHLGQGATHLQHQPAHHSTKQQPQHHSHPGMGGSHGVSNSSSIKALGTGALQPQGSYLASKAGMLQEQNNLQGRSSHHGMQVSSARYQKSGKGGMLQPAGSLASSMSNLSSLQLGGAVASKHNRGAAAGAMHAGAVSMSAAGNKPGSQYVSPYGQRGR